MTDRSTIRELGTFGEYSARLLCRGDRYGLDGAAIHDSDQPVIEYYRGGSLVSRYSVSALCCIERTDYAAGTPRCGLLLDGGTNATIGMHDKLASLRAALAYMSRATGWERLTEEATR